MTQTTWNGKEERNTWEREVSRKDGLGHQDNVDGRQEQRKSTPAKSGTFYSSSDSETSSSEEDEILAAARTEVEDDNSGDREVKFSLKISGSSVSISDIFSNLI